MAKLKNNPDFIRVGLGSITNYVNAKFGKRIFTGSKANWEVIYDNVPSHESW